MPTNDCTVLRNCIVSICFKTVVNDCTGIVYKQYCFRRYFAISHSLMFMLSEYWQWQL